MREARRFEVGVAVSYALLVLVLAIPALALGNAFKAAESRAHVVTRATDAVLRAVRIQAEAGQIAAAARAYLLTGDPSLLARARMTDVLSAGVRALRGDVHTGEENAILDSLDLAMAHYTDILATATSTRATSGGAPTSEVVAMFENSVLPRERVIADELGNYIALREQAIEPLTAAAEAAFSRALIVSSAAVVLAVLASALLGLYSAHKLVQLYTAERASAKRAADAVAARDELLWVVAHDLRSPLAAISLRAAIIRRAADTTFARQAGAIESTALRMEALIKTLLDTASIQEGRFTVSPSATSVRCLISEAREAMASQAAAKSIALAVKASEEDLWVRADRYRLVEVLVNLLDNAIKFTPTGGTIEIVVTPVGEMVRFSVTDSGPGIAASEASHLFERFWTGQRGGKGGTGLGLYIARGIIEAHGGRIWVESGPSRGSTFSFTLSRATPSARETQRGAGEDAAR